MSTIRIFCILTTSILLIGCAAPPSGVSPTIVATQPAISLTAASQIPTPDAVATSLKTGFSIQSYCPDIILGTDKLPSLTGTLVISGNNILINDTLYSPDPDQSSLLLFWETGSEKITVYQLPESQRYYYYVTSPDKERLAFTEGKTLSMVSDVAVLDRYAEENGKFTLLDDWNLFDWLNNEVLLVRQNRLQKDKHELIAVNPANGEQQFLPANFPNMYSSETLVVWGALTIFNPTLSRVLYPKYEENKIAPVLWDVDNNKEIARITGNYQPKWSPDGEQLLIVANYKPTDFDHEDIFLVKLDGSETRVTFFKDHLERNSIHLPAWSPDGRHVAFWLSTDMPIETARLAVLNIATSTVDIYCNELIPFPFRFGDYNTLGYAYDQVNSAPPIWSPDSRYLLIENYEQGTSSTYLFDLNNHTITRIAENARPVSWLK